MGEPVPPMFWFRDPERQHAAGRRPGGLIIPSGVGAFPPPRIGGVALAWRGGGARQQAEALVGVGTSDCRRSPHRRHGGAQLGRLARRRGLLRQGAGLPRRPLRRAGRIPPHRARAAKRPARLTAVAAAVVVVGGLDLRVAQQAPLAVLAADARLLVAGVVGVDRLAERAVDVDLAEVERRRPSASRSP